MANVTISTSVPVDIYEEVRNKEHWHWNELIYMGIQAKKSMPNVLERQNGFEESNARLTDKVQKLARDRFELQDELDKLREEVFILKGVSNCGTTKK